MKRSPVTITLTPHAISTPLVLIAAGDWLEDFPTFEASQDLHEVDGVLLANSYFRPLGNVAVTIQITVEKDHGDLLEALEDFLDYGIEGGTGLLLVDGAVDIIPAGGGDSIHFAEAVVSAITPDLPTGDTSTTLHTITIKTSLPEP